MLIQRYVHWSLLKQLTVQDAVRISQLPSDTIFDYSWPLRKITIGEQVDHLAYSSSSGMYVLGTSHQAEFKLPDDDELHPEWGNEGSTTHSNKTSAANNQTSLSSHKSTKAPSNSSIRRRGPSLTGMSPELIQDLPTHKKKATT